MRRILAALAAAAAAGCAQDQGSTLSCPGPDATGCDPLSTVFERTAGSPAKEAEPVVVRRMAAPSEPRLDPPRLLRVWIAPWRDADGDLHDQQHVHIVLEEAAWSLGGGTAPAAKGDLE